ncbi:MAG: hypothetical protein ACREUL_06325 [Steroidobacteraceae bacterium]
MPQSVVLDGYILDSLMVDLVGHDRRPSAYILYLALRRLSRSTSEVGISLQGLATATGLSKTACPAIGGALGAARSGEGAARRTDGGVAVQGA